MTPHEELMQLCLQNRDKWHAIDPGLAKLSPEAFVAYIVSLDSRLFDSIARKLGASAADPSKVH